MLLAHKVALDPNMAQRVYFARAAGTARFAWNWAWASGRANTRPVASRPRGRCGSS